MSLSAYFGSEKSGNRALSVSHAPVGSRFFYGNVETARPALTTNTTTVRRTYCLAVDYTTGHAWWGIDGYFGGYNPVTRVAVSGRTAQVHPADITSDFDINRMRYVVLRPYESNIKIYLKSSYQYTPAGFTPFYTGAIQGYSETPFNLRTSGGATWTSSSVADTLIPALVTDDNMATYFSTSETNVAGPEWIQVQHPYAVIVNKIRIITTDASGTVSNLAPSIFKIRGSNDNGVTWTDVYTRTVSNNWHDPAKAIYYLGANTTAPGYQDIFFFPNNTAYQTYRLEDATLTRMVIASLDMFYVDPAGVNVQHYETYYSTPMPRFTDTFTDRSTVPRSLSYNGYTMSQGTNVDIIGFSASSSPITPSGDFTVMVPIRLSYATIGSGDRLAYFALGVAGQIRYDGRILMAITDATQPTTTLPDHTSRWYNNYHVLSIVYNAATNKCKTYLHYYTTDPNVVSSISPSEVTIGSYSRQELKFNWQGSSQPLGNINIRPATMFPSALSETVLTAAAKKIIQTGKINVINPGDYVPSQFATVELFKASSIMQLDPRGALPTIESTQNVLTTGFFKLNNTQCVFTSPITRFGSYNMISCEFKSSSSSSAVDSDFTILMGDFFMIHNFQNNTFGMQGVPTPTTTIAASTNHYKYEIVVTNGTNGVYTIYDVSNGNAIVERRSVTRTFTSGIISSYYHIRCPFGRDMHIGKFIAF